MLFPKIIQIISQVLLLAKNLTNADDSGHRKRMTKKDEISIDILLKNTLETTPGDQPFCWNPWGPVERWSTLITHSLLFWRAHSKLLSSKRFSWAPKGFIHKNPMVSMAGSKIPDMGVSKNRGTPKSWILIGFSLINHPFWGTPIFGNSHIFVGGLVCTKMKPGALKPGAEEFQKPIPAPNRSLPNE